MTSLPANPARDDAPRDELCRAIARLETPGEALRFLRDLCTPGEIQAMAERWEIARLLAAGGQSYRDIHARTGASLTTITRVARFLGQEPHQGYRMMIERLSSGAREMSDE
jgi:TrpR-related protein YerC/YecD